MPDQETWTIGRLLEWTADFLTQKEVESPRLDAELLLANARGCERIDLYTAYDEIASDEIRSRFRGLVQQRAAGTPVAHLLGRREFYSLNFHVTPDVLIPRPETELLVVALLDRIKQADLKRPVEVADVGTGCGIVAICAAKFDENCCVTAIDISAPALKVAAGNARDHGVEARIEFVESDLLASLPREKQFDIIASNPPYVSESELEQLSRDVRQYEPDVALRAGPKGTEIIERLVAEACGRLAVGGWLLMEVSPMIYRRVEEILHSGDYGRWELSVTKHDLAGHPRVVQAEKLDAGPQATA